MSDPLENPAVTENLLENGGECITRTGVNPAEAGAKDVAKGDARAQLVEECRAYLRVIKRSPATIAATLRPLKPFFAYIDARGLDLRAVSWRDMEAYHVHLKQSGRYVENSVHTYLRAVGRFYVWLERTGRVLISPMEGMTLPKPRNTLPRAVLSAAEMRRLLDAPDTSTRVGIRDRALLELLYSTGLRVSELCSLTVHDVDTRAGYVRVNGGKGGKDRVVPMGRRASDHVREYLQHVRGHFTKRQRDGRALFVGEHNGKKINLLVIERRIRDFARSAGIKKRVTPHVLRHTCATHLIQGGASVVHVQRILGHASLSSTQIYARVAAQDVKATHARTHPRASR